MVLPQVEDHANVSMGEVDAAPEHGIQRRASMTTETFTNHQGMDEFRKCKNEWINRLDDTNSVFEDAFAEQDHIFSKFTLKAFIEGTMSVLKTDERVARIEAAQTPPPIAAKSPTKSKQLAIRTRPHSIEPLPMHRSKALQARLATMPQLDFSGSGKMNFSLGRMVRRPKLPKPKELTVVTGKVDYRQLREEQRKLNNQTAAADEGYKTMIADFDAFQDTLQRRFSFLLEEGNPCMNLQYIPEKVQNKMLVNVPDNVWKKVGGGMPSGEVAYEL
uniref:Uncharacterized protein n=1 Tax=Eutreptiella gymnastica TaxID=73025 RepID=A0A7S1IDI5_9EUGL|mmetsp:Transcript_149043/g.260469  ORF Transcript_149043/g.260469 Transcript_149043/m.260469 type:complete len:274 (+) Transcript_149043:85-906(+)